MSRVYKIGSEGIGSEGKPEKILESVGVAVRDSEGQFRDFSDILDDLDKKWGNMTQTEQTAVAQQVAGIQRYNDFISLMNNYQIATDATTKAINSQGSATKENAIYMESAQAKLNTLKATMQSMALNTFNSQEMRTTLTVVNELALKLANFPTIIMAIVTAFALWKGTQITAFLTPIISQIGAIITSEYSGVLATTALSASFKGLTSAMLANPIALVAVALTGLIVILDNVKSTSDKLQESLDKISKIKQTISDVKDATNLANQYNELETKINSGKLSTDEMTQANKDLVSIQEKLANQFPDLVNGWDSEGNAIVSNLDKVNEKIKETKQQSLQDLDAEYKTAYNTMFNNAYLSQSGVGGAFEYLKKFTDGMRQFLHGNLDDANSNDSNMLGTTVQQYQRYLNKIS